MEGIWGLIIWFTATPDLLVLELGSASFRKRESAEVQLLQWRGLALRSVQKGRQHPSNEISRRCVDLYPKILKLALVDQISAALKQVPPSWEPKTQLPVELPGRTLWKKVVGNDAASELAYLEAIQEQPELFLTLATDIESVPEKVKHFDKLLKSRGYDLMTSNELNILLYFGNVKIPSLDKTDEFQDAMNLWSLLEFEKIPDILHSSETTKKLFTYWIKKNVTKPRAENCSM